MRSVQADEAKDKEPMKVKGCVKQTICALHTERFFKEVVLNSSVCPLTVSFSAECVSGC